MEAEPSYAEIKELVLQIKEALAKQDTPSLQTLLNSVKHGKAQHVVDFVAPLLFQPENNAEDMSLAGDEALGLISRLVHSDSSTYLKPVSRAVKQEAVLRASSDQSMHVSNQLMTVIIDQLSSTDVEVSSNATEAMVACCRRLGPSISSPCIDSITQVFIQAYENMSKDRSTSSIICVRCASVIVDLIVALGDQVMDKAKSSGATDMLLKMLTNCETDPLLAMSVMDLIERMATSNPMHGNRAHFLCSNDVLDPLLTMAGGKEDSPGPDPILGGSALRVLSAICRLGQRDSSLFGDSEHQRLLQGFHKALENFRGTGELDRLALVDAISSFAASSPDALEMVLNDPRTKEDWLLLSVAQPKLKAVILTSVAMVIDPAPEKDINGKPVTTTANLPSSAMAMKLFTQLGNTNNSQDSTELLLELAKSPIQETRLGAYNLMRAVATRITTGSQVLLSHTGFYEFLIRREGESTKEGKEGKFAIVEAVYKSPAKGLLADDIVRKLEQILKQGAHYVEPLKPELMTD